MIHEDSKRTKTEKEQERLRNLRTVLLMGDGF